jgi:hypothetical protein
LHSGTQQKQKILKKKSVRFFHKCNAVAVFCLFSKEGQINQNALFDHKIPKIKKNWVRHGHYCQKSGSESQNTGF